jgi:hypothetical protein
MMFVVVIVAIVVARFEFILCFQIWNEKIINFFTFCAFCAFCSFCFYSGVKKRRVGSFVLFS